MVLKKQTVWLMTMVSLTIVLAVYYITSPDEVAEEAPEGEEQSDEVTAMMEDEELVEWLSDEEMETTIEETDPSAEESVNGENAGEQAGETTDSLFSEFRLERDESRSRLREEYTETIASDDFTAAEKSEAYDKREALEERQHRESTLENLIQSEGYEEAVVMPGEDSTRIIVQAEKLSEEEAVALNRLAAEQLGAQDIVIGHRSASN